MKYLLLIVLALSGCAPAVAPRLLNPPVPEQITRGFNSISGVGYECRQTESNSALVWIECDFHNFTDDYQKMCIQVSYNTSVTVATSRVLCAKQIIPGDIKPGFIAFTNKNGLQQLQQNCGLHMISCKLTAEEVVQ